MPVVRGLIPAELKERATKAPYLLPVFVIASAYVLIDSFYDGCCDKGTYAEAGIAFSIFSIVYSFYLVVRLWVLDEVMLVWILDFDTLFAFVNMGCWLAGLVLLTFADNGRFEELGLGIMATWANFIAAMVDFATTWKMVPSFDDGGQGQFNFKVNWAFLLIVSLLLVLACAAACLLNDCPDGESFGIMIGFVSCVTLMWVLVFDETNPYKTLVVLINAGVWMFGVVGLTVAEPFFVDGKIEVNFFGLIWVGFLAAVSLLIQSNYTAHSEVVSFFSPHLMGFVMATLVLFVAQPTLYDFCEGLEFEINSTVPGDNTTDTNTTRFLGDWFDLGYDLDFWVLADNDTVVNGTTDDDNSRKLCEVFDYIAVGALGFIWVCIGIILIIKNKFGEADAADTLRKGGKALLLIWLLAAVCLTFPIESPFAFANTAYVSIWAGFGILFHLSYFDEEALGRDGTNLRDLEHYMLEGKAGAVFTNLKHKEGFIREALYLIAFGSLIHLMASIFACGQVNEDDPGEARCTYEELISVGLGGSTLIALFIMLLIFTKSVEFWTKAFLLLVWVGAGWIPIIMGPFDDLQGNGYFSTFVVIPAVVAYAVLDPARPARRSLTSR